MQVNLYVNDELHKTVFNNGNLDLYRGINPKSIKIISFKLDYTELETIKEAYDGVPLSFKDLIVDEITV